MQISIANIIRGTLIGNTMSVLTRYISRVVNGGGIVEAPQCVETSLNSQSLLQQASLLVVPSGYKGGTLYSEIPTNGNGDLTWTRGSDAFRTNASGLIQRVPWNLLQQSETFDNAIWSKTNTTIVANAETAPNGTLTADTMTVPDSTTNLSQGVSYGSGEYTFSVYVKIISQTTGGVMRLQGFVDGANVSMNFTPTTEWQLFTATFNATTSITSLRIRGQAFVGTLAIWGAQLVQGTTAQTYLPTTDRLNFPRLSYMYGSCPSVLLEPQRTNLLTYSQAFADASWTKIASSTGSISATDNYNASPDGTNNASRLVINNVSTAYVAKAFSSVNASSYTISIYAKSNTSSNYTFQLRDGYSGAVSGNLTVTPTWQRFTFTFTASGTTAELQFRTTIAGAYDLSIYGAQGELGAYPTTYISTTSATATRVADSFSRNNIYTNGLITSSGGTWFVELRGNVAYSRDVFGALWVGSDSTSANNGNSLSIRNSGGASRRLSLVKTVSGTISSLYETTTDIIKVAIKWNGTSADYFVNGTKQVSATPFTATNMEFLAQNAIVPMFIQQMALYTEPLTDTKLIELTTI